uniref:Solute carrier family 38 member 5b n=1 Tax=Oncorhynchus kisutch TaxID=8019 RepID=A0A8C7J8D2_ONCKI
MLPYKSDGTKKPQFTDFEGKTSFGMSVFNLSNAIMGSGILGLSYAMSNTGIVLFIILLTCIACLSSYSVHLLLKSAGVVGIRAYEQLGFRAFGHPGKIAAGVIITFHNIGAMSSYLFIVKYELPLVIQAFLGLSSNTGDWFLNGNYLIIIVSVCVILPLALMRQLGYLGYTSGFSLTCMVFFLSSVSDFLMMDVYTTAYTIPILAFAFVCHPEVLPIYTELKNATKRRMQGIANVSIMGMFVMYLLTAIFGYLTFYVNTESELLHTYSKVDPLDTLILCVLVPELGTTLGVCGGATTAPSLIFILPGLFYLRIVPPEQEPMKSRPKITAACFTAMGFIFMSMSLTFIIIDWTTGEKRAGGGH